MRFRRRSSRSCSPSAKISYKSDFIDINKDLAKIVDTIDYRFNKQRDGNEGPTGLKDLDELSGGLQKSDLIIVGARPSMGKTSLPVST
ncbi:DnaB-like helicase C-terminal domain-containing protein [Pseudomonas aeruginosa]